MYKVTLNLYRTTWHYFTTNPVGGGFGSNYCGPKYIALARAIQNIPDGAQYELVTNDRRTGIFVKDVQ